MSEQPKARRYTFPLLCGQDAELVLPVPLSPEDFDHLTELLTSFLMNAKPALIKRPGTAPTGAKKDPF